MFAGMGLTVRRVDPRDRRLVVLNGSHAPDKSVGDALRRHEAPLKECGPTRSDLGQLPPTPVSG